MKKQYEIAVIVKAVNSDFWQMLLMGAKKAMKENPEKINVKTYGPPEESDIEEQVKILEGLVDEKPDAIVIASTSNDLTVPAIEKAVEMGIPVVTADNKVNTDQFTSFFATDNMAAAGLAAEAMYDEWMKEGISTKGKTVIVFNSMKDSKVDQDRDKGFIDRIKELAPDLGEIETKFVENSATLTTEITEKYLQEDDSLVGIFADNDQTGVGAANAILKAETSRVKVYAFDAAEEEIKALTAGGISGLVVQDPVGMGYKGVMCAVDALEGRPVDKEVDTGATIVTKSNINDPAVQKLLYPEE